MRGRTTHRMIVVAAGALYTAIPACSGKVLDDGGRLSHDGGPSTGGASGVSGASGRGATASGGTTAKGGAPPGGTSGTTGSAGAGGSPPTADASTCAATCVIGFTAGTCCAGECAGLDNDPHNCGACGTVCPPDAPVCLHTRCVAQQCGDPTMLGAPVPDGGPVCKATERCCGNFCCQTNEICCSVHGGGTNNGLELGCYDPSQSNGTCPRGCPACVCASPDTPIATPSGERPIAELRVGDLVYSVDHGATTAVPLVRVNRTPVSAHAVMRVALVTGAVLEISPLHPTADGRKFGGLRGGDSLDGVRVTSATLVPYTHDATYDILPASDTGAYFAGGALIGSTLAAGAVLLTEPTVPASAH